MKLILLLSFLSSSVAWAASPHEFNSALMKDVYEDIKQERYEPKKENLRKPASIERYQEDFEKQEYLRKNKVNGLHEKW